MSEIVENKNIIVEEKATLLDKEAVNNSKKCYLFFKRFQDIVLSFLAIITLLPVLLIVSLIVFIECPSVSPIFVQKRVGKNGKTFKFYKFRSMCPNAEAKLESLLELNEVEGHAFKIHNDPRITKVGKFIRKTSIDELPQLWNILKGDMSIVGPRPPIPREVEEYTEFEKQRLLVTPGLTCYWQSTPHRNDVSFEEWVKLDIKYINERSFCTDWKIIIKTFLSVLGMDNI